MVSVQIVTIIYTGVALAMVATSIICCYSRTFLRVELSKIVDSLLLCNFRVDSVELSLLVPAGELLSSLRSFG